MMEKPSEILHKKAKEMEKLIPDYMNSSDFKKVHENALINFIKRVRRGLMPSLSAIDGLKASYEKIRQIYKSNLGYQGKPTKSNATATGQMLEAMTSEKTDRGFVLYVKDDFRTKELTGANPKLLNSEVAHYYAIKRKIFDFSKPEFDRIKRQIVSDLLKLIRKSN